MKQLVRLCARLSLRPVCQRYRPWRSSRLALRASASADSSGPVVLDWTPPALAQLSVLAPVKYSFTLDRTMLGAAASIWPDTDEPTRQAINRLDGVSVHLLRFGDAADSRRRRGEAAFARRTTCAAGSTW